MVRVYYSKTIKRESIRNEREIKSAKFDLVGLCALLVAMQETLKNRKKRIEYLDKS